MIDMPETFVIPRHFPIFLIGVLVLYENESIVMERNSPFFLSSEMYFYIVAEYFYWVQSILLFVYSNYGMFLIWQKVRF
jgi:hypothetical protein